MKYPAWLPILLGFLTAIGPISTDMYLPAFPAIEASLGLKLGSAQVTLATWFLGLAVGQITQGQLADRFGRRTPLIFGSKDKVERIARYYEGGVFEIQPPLFATRGLLRR